MLRLLTLRSLHFIRKMFEITQRLLGIITFICLTQNWQAADLLPHLKSLAILKKQIFYLKKCTSKKQD